MTSTIFADLIRRSDENGLVFHCSYGMTTKVNFHAHIYINGWFVNIRLFLHIWCHIIVIVIAIVTIINFLIVDLISDSALCQHAKKVCSSCGASGGGNGGGAAVSSVTKQQNGASKESKELKSKKPNWGIKLNCKKLKIKPLSSSLSSERKYIEM